MHGARNRTFPRRDSEADPRRIPDSGPRVKTAFFSVRIAYSGPGFGRAGKLKRNRFHGTIGAAETRCEDRTMHTAPMLETLLFGGTLYAGPHLRERVEALGIREGKVAAAGSRESLERLCNERTVRRNLNGGCLLPGLIDPHNHFSFASLTPLMADCRTPPVRSVEEILGRMRQQAELVEPGGWVVGWGYDEHLLDQPRNPTRWDLDDACPGHPALLIHLTLHQCVANSLALEYCGIDRRTRDPAGGRIGRDLWGLPDGRLFEQAAMPPLDTARGDLVTQAGEDMAGLYRENALRLLRLGVVRLTDAAMRPCDVRLWETFGLPQEIHILLDRMEVGRQGMMSPPVHLFGTDREDRPVVKLFLDGALQCAMESSIRQMALGGWAAVLRAANGRKTRAALRHMLRVEARLDRSGTVHLGYLVNDPAQVETTVAEAHQRGFPVAVHALGNAAVRRVLEIFERVQDRYGAPERPFRVEHALFLTEDLIEKMARLNVAAVVQPSFLYQYGPLLETLPLPGGVKILPLRSMIDAGVLVSGSSDGPCAGEDPLLAMDCACRRRTQEGACLDESQAIGVNEAILLYTANAARVMGCREDAGSLESGKRADLVLLTGDPHRKGFDRVRVAETIVAGTTVWERGKGPVASVVMDVEKAGSMG